MKRKSRLQPAFSVFGGEGPPGNRVILHRCPNCFSGRSKPVDRARPAYLYRMRLPLLAGAVLLSAAALAQTPAAMPASSAAPATVTAQPSRMHTLSLRLRPGQDLRQQLTALVAQQRLPAGAVLTCVGSLTQVTLRLANQEGPTVYRGHFEIVSLVGTLAESGSHLHLAVADSTGRTIGGHLLDGCLVFTTAELVLGVLDDVSFRREADPTFGYRELAVYPAERPKDRTEKKAPKAKK